MEIITGFLLGLSTLVFIGAVFFYLIKTAIVSGKKAGVAVASGIIIGDILYVVLLLFGFSEVFENEVFVRWFAFFGGTLLVMIGIRYLIKKRDISEAKSASKGSLWAHFTKGFVLNFINPFVATVWVGFLAINEEQFSSSASVITSLTITLAVIFLTDLLKIFYAEKLRRLLRPSVLQKTFNTLGIIIILLGLRLFYEFF
ncbi:MAG: threonine/homoserine/homoserine lactone efflux protein [Planctomycetota bacterium]|jgi:threonine/homoserine/homoserine lactone efflux protein|uniref:LysE family translocator n=1 Tax=Patiriisocius sp. Uisw_047 TaxID=3230969 RepID=UPI0039E91032